MNDIRPFRLHIAESELDDLAGRLTNTRWPSEPADAGWDYGIPLARVRQLADVWQRFDWRAHEDALNALPQYTTTIDGENVYFIHVRSASPDALPLILTHGW